MYHSRVIPCLLLKDKGLVKTKQFGHERYVGDPINAVKIFNECEADELIFLDIDKDVKKTGPNFEYLRKITSQCFMPVCYGGGCTTLEDFRKLFYVGFEKVSVNTAAYYDPDLIRKAVDSFGSQSIVGSMDILDKKGRSTVMVKNGRIDTHKSPLEYAVYLERLGVGEILINDINSDGMRCGYQYAMIKAISQAVKIPVIACGGADTLEDCQRVLQEGAAAAAAGSMFVFWGRNQAVLINYRNLDNVFEENLNGIYR